jgi:hypothetical protein
MVSANNEGGVHMYVTEQTYVIVYLAISFVIVQGRIGLRTIRTSINYAHRQTSQLSGGKPVRGASHLESWHRLVQTIEHLD